jgi:hypothetical protein
MISEGCDGLFGTDGSMNTFYTLKRRGPLKFQAVRSTLLGTFYCADCLILEGRFDLVQALITSKRKVQLARARLSFDVLRYSHVLFTFDRIRVRARRTAINAAFNTRQHESRIQRHEDFRRYIVSQSKVESLLFTTHNAYTSRGLEELRQACAYLR